MRRFPIIDEIPTQNLQTAARGAVEAETHADFNGELLNAAKVQRVQIIQRVQKYRGTEVFRKVVIR